MTARKIIYLALLLGTLPRKKAAVLPSENANTAQEVCIDRCILAPGFPKKALVPKYMLTG